MPVVDSSIRGSGKPEADGSYRDVIDVIFDDGRVESLRVTAPDSTAWSETLLEAENRALRLMQERDANDVVESDAEIEGPVKEASPAQQAVAYLRRAMETKDSYEAYRKFSRFNNYRLARGWNINVVQTRLEAAGLTPEEWEEMKARFQYLNEPSRVTAMEACQGVYAGDVWAQE